MLDNYLKRTTLKGSVREWMTPGLAVEFLQPWYTPLPTTPATTGMPLGGIGSTFTVTAAGTTPVLNVLPGIQVRGANPGDLRLNDFFFRESPADAPLEILNLTDFCRHNKVYRLAKSSGGDLFPLHSPAGEYQQLLTDSLHDPNLWSVNQSRLQRWKVELSARTQTLLDQGLTDSPQFHRLWLQDFFDGAVGPKATWQGSLSAAWNEQEFHGQPGYDADLMEFASLYPVSRTSYSGNHLCKITRYQYSPVLPGDEYLSSLPASMSLFTFFNPTEQEQEISLVRLQDNLVGYQVLKERQGVQDASFVLQPAARHPSGESFRRVLSKGEMVQGVILGCRDAKGGGDFSGQMALGLHWPTGAGWHASTKPMFYQSDRATVLKTALASGRVNQRFVKNVYCGRETIASALCATCVVPPGATVQIAVHTVLDFPLISLPGLESSKKYTAFHPNHKDRALQILLECADRDEEIQRRIANEYPLLMPEPVLQNLTGPAEASREKFRTMAYNTLAFLAEASVWDCEDRLLVRECADYPFFNSLDVYFYGSFSLLTMFARLDGCVMRNFAEAILWEEKTVRRHHEFVNHPHADLPDPKLEGARGVRGAVIHDLGSPFDARPDAYDWHNVKEWKDLAPKFVLMVLRHFRRTGDRSLLQDCKEAVYASMDYLSDMVEEGQDFPLTHGTDDTFDNLSSHGISVYCGSLWIAGLRAASAIARELGDTGRADMWNEKADSCQEVFHRALWDEKEGYFHFFVTPVGPGDLRAQPQNALLRLLELSPLASNSKVVIALNSLLDSDKIPSTITEHPDWQAPENSGRLSLRKAKKIFLQKAFNESFTPAFAEKLYLDSDDVFADQLLADTYLRLLKLDPLCTGEQAARALQRVVQTNYKANSPRIGAANLVHANGQPLDEGNFQAHDVWIGIQFSLMTSMALHGLQESLLELSESTYRNLYLEARIPFAAPEGFNGSCRLHISELEKKLGLNSDNALLLMQGLLQKKVLLADQRIASSLTTNFAEFETVWGKPCRKLKVECKDLFALLHSTALKYTAGRYFRPGMVWAVPNAGALLY